MARGVWASGGLALAVLAGVLAGCDKEAGPMEFKEDAALKSDLAKVATYRVFFGHQSVGGNIVEGLGDLSKETGVPLNVVKYAKGDSLPGAFFAHAYVGENRNTESKLNDFGRLAGGELAGKVDVALVKFCYVDIHKDSPVDSIFKSYVATVEKLRKEHPATVFVPVTSPLMVKEGWNKYKYYLKSLMGVENDNVNRNKFNAMLRTAFAGGPIFDLAAVEAGLSHDGSPVDPQGKQLALRREFTSDGGHLNETGRKVAAQALVETLARIPIAR